MRCERTNWRRERLRATQNGNNFDSPSGKDTIDDSSLSCTTRPERIVAWANVNNCAQCWHQVAYVSECHANAHAQPHLTNATYSRMLHCIVRPCDCRCGLLLFMQRLVPYPLCLCAAQLAQHWPAFPSNSRYLSVVFAKFAECGPK